jgi:glycosyltransferase involved in cell wall biosynthesis
MTAEISVVLNTLDAERYLPYALRSVATWATDIVVVDMASTDRTVAIAREHGARVVPCARADCVEAARAFAVAQARAPWVLLLDADELVPLGLSRRLQTIVDEGSFDVVRMSRRNHLLGGPLLHTGWNPERDRPVRFFRPDAVELPTRIHDPIRPRPGARVLELSYGAAESLVHFNYTDVDDFVTRLARYTSVEADHAVARGERSGRARSIVVALHEWVVRFVWHGGWRDGWRGFHLAVLMAAYRLIVQAKIASREQLGSEADVLRGYVREAERVLAEYQGPRASAAGVDPLPRTADLAQPPAST